VEAVLVEMLSDEPLGDAADGDPGDAGERAAAAVWSSLCASRPPAFSKCRMKALR